MIIVGRPRISFGWQINSIPVALRAQGVRIWTFLQKHRKFKLHLRGWGLRRRRADPLPQALIRGDM
jgi:hypothetical protein